MSDRLTIIKQPVHNVQNGDLPFAEAIIESLIKSPQYSRTIPYRFFYDEAGSELFEQITTTEEYYLTRRETEILKEQSDEIAKYLKKQQKLANEYYGSTTEKPVLIELGSGSSTKTALIIESLLRSQGELQYSPIDISGEILEISSQRLLDTYPNLKIKALHGLYQQGLEYAAREFEEQSKLIIFLGSSIGNFNGEESVEFLRGIRENMTQFDSLLIGFDLKKEKLILEAAYDDSLKITSSFNMNLLNRINRELNANFDLTKWKHKSEWNNQHSRIEMKLVSLADQIVNFKYDGRSMSMNFAKGETIHTENCHKYSPFMIEKLALCSGFQVKKLWMNDSDPKFSLALLQPISSENNIALTSYAPSIISEQIQTAWKFSDRILGLLNSKGFQEKPITLRHPFIFYLGHLPAFANNQIIKHQYHYFSKHITEISLRSNPFPHFDTVFERGIDPDVDDPTKCHAHSEVPPEWPSIDSIVRFREHVRSQVLNRDLVRVLCSEENSEKNYNSIDLLSHKGRVYRMVAEHDLMHAETLLYMYLRLDKMYKQIPSDSDKNYILSRKSYNSTKYGNMVEIPAGFTTLGADLHSVNFGWDNEFPKSRVEVPKFKMSQYPITIAQFLEFIECGEYENEKNWDEASWTWKEKSNLHHPSNWQKISKDENESAVYSYLTIFDEIPLDEVLDHPVYVSHAEASAYAKWKGMRLPTEAEFHRAAYGRANRIQRRVSGDLSEDNVDNNGRVEDDDDENSFPWGDAEAEIGSNGHGNFGLYSMNTCPVDQFPRGASAFGVHDLIGNGWEITDTVFGPLPGFENYLQNYQGYSSDFFDGKHFVQCGGSWATAVPLVRKSFRNWYQSHYQYTFSKFRLVQ